jgi:hypothetical protein
MTRAFWAAAAALMALTLTGSIVVTAHVFAPVHVAVVQHAIQDGMTVYSPVPMAVSLAAQALGLWASVSGYREAAR